MRLVSAQRAEDIQSKVKARFAEFNRTSSPSKGRKYPQELQALACQALGEGVELPVLCQLTGASSTALARWFKTAKPATALASRRRPKVAAPRQLEVVCSDVGTRPRPIIVRLPSGVSIELGDGVALNGELLTALSALGGGHATSR